MRFLIIRTSARQNATYVRPNHELLAAMSHYYSEELTRPSAFPWTETWETETAVRVKLSVTAHNRPQPVDDQAQEVASLALIQADSLEAAMDWARNWPAVTDDWSAEIEIRRIPDATHVLVPEIPA